MSKAILVMDMPDCCKECDFCEETARDTHVCSRVVDNGKYRRINHTTEYKECEKPKWCPLKEVPQKKDYSKISDYSITAYQMQGYNDCLNEILGGGE